MLRLFFLAVLLLGAAAAGAAYWTLARDDGAKADVQEVRWGNVTVSVNEESGVVADRTFVAAQIKPPNGGPALILRRGDSALAIDVDTGKVLEDFVKDEDRAAIQSVFSTLAVGEQDKQTAPWPYAGAPPSVSRERFGGITLIPPDPASGVIIRQMLNDPGGLSLRVTNGRSTLSIDAETGNVIKEITLILPEDKEAFDRFLSTVEYLGPSP